MKPRYSIPALAILFIFLTSCNDDNEVKVQNQDDNEMMAIMNTMSAEMEATEMRGDADDDFATMMIIHHQGAIDMGMKQIAKGDDSELKIRAKTMIDMQQSEMDKLDLFLYEHVAESSEEGEQWGIEAEASLKRMNNDADLQVLAGDADHDFCLLMIQHHRSANDMAQSLLHYGHHEELKEIANKMIADQNLQIEELQNWLLQNKPE